MRRKNEQMRNLRNEKLAPNYFQHSKSTRLLRIRQQFQICCVYKTLLTVLNCKGFLFRNKLLLIVRQSESCTLCNVYMLRIYTKGRKTKHISLSTTALDQFSTTLMISIVK